MARRRLVAGNWKMHTGVAEALALADAIRAGLPAQPPCDILLLPPFISLWAVGRRLAGDARLQLGAQNMHWAQPGPHTGEIAAAMLTDLCTHVLLGHSERRQEFGETDAVVHRKVESALTCGLLPIVAVGETLAEHEAGRAGQVVRAQIGAAVGGLSEDEAARCTVAYEPRWAIGTGRAASVEDAVAAGAAIRGELREQVGPVAETVRILYGGSVDETNAAAFFAAPAIDGALVGGASLRPDAFCAIVRAAGPAG
ncbi:MAG TPA: triose-phosphate isomerase [Candidatus Micrarchaeia archaeon]|nr:triose-phosphate isomerase [Candidatus Micrarchaeia archaeon]